MKKNSLGFLYIAKRSCGKISAACWEDSNDEEFVNKFEKKCNDRGDFIIKVERFNTDPPLTNWICDNCTFEECLEFNKIDEKK